MFDTVEPLGERQDGAGEAERHGKTQVGVERARVALQAIIYNRCARRTDQPVK